MSFEMSISYGSVVLRLFAALVLGGALGLEREWSRRPAGLRTHILVACAAALYTLLSGAAAEGGQGPGDPSRVAANVATGIGFIGAGTIMRQGNIVRGLTTAASLWMAAAIGVACGLEWYPAALTASVMSIVVLALFDIIEQRWLSGGDHFVMTVENTGQGTLADMTRSIEQTGVKVKSVRERTVEGTTTRTISVIAELPDDFNHAQIREELLTMEGVQDVE